MRLPFALVLALVLIVLTAGAGEAEHTWTNNITVNEYNMTWHYTETFTGADSIAYRMSIDTELGNNDSFVSAWELLLADKEMRKNLRSAIDKESDVKINNKTSGIEAIDIDSELSPDAIGKAHMQDAIMNRYNVTYRFKDSILNASNFWLLGQAKTPVTVVIPEGVDIINISGMGNITKNTAGNSEISGFFKEVSKDRGEITLSLAGNTSFRKPEVDVLNFTSPAALKADLQAENNTKPISEALSKIREAGIIGIGVIIVILVYAFKVRRR